MTRAICFAAAACGGGARSGAVTLAARVPTRPGPTQPGARRSPVACYCTGPLAGLSDISTLRTMGFVVDHMHAPHVSAPHVLYDPLLPPQHTAHATELSMQREATDVAEFAETIDPSAGFLTWRTTTYAPNAAHSGAGPSAHAQATTTSHGAHSPAEEDSGGGGGQAATEGQHAAAHHQVHAAPMGSAYTRAPTHHWTQPATAEHLAEAVRRAEHARRTIHGDGLDKLLRHASHGGGN